MTTTPTTPCLNVEPGVCLLVALLQDAERRNKILGDEIANLLAQMHFRLAQAKTSDDDAAHDGMAGPFPHLISCSKMLEREVDAFKAHLSSLSATCSEHILKDPSSLPGPAPYSTMTANLMLVVNAIRGRHASYITTLNELQTRFEQSVKYSIPDHPSPQIRGLRDSAIADRYFTELARNTYRDIAIFCVGDLQKKGNGTSQFSNYPFQKVPRVFVTRRAETNSSMSRWVKTDEHPKWIAWFHKNMYGDLAQADSGYVGKPGSMPERFVTVRLPYWMPDALEVAPVIGHELAHAVLDDIVGRLAGDRWDQKSDSRLAVLFRTCAKLLCAFEPNLPETAMLAYTQEILVDLLALARFRGGFLYTAAFLSLEDSTLCGFSDDEFAQSRVDAFLRSVYQKPDPYTTLLNAPLMRSAIEMSDANSEQMFFTVVRLELLARLTPQIDKSPFAQELARDVRQYIETLTKIPQLQVRYQRDEGFVPLLAGLQKTCEELLIPAIKATWYSEKLPTRGYHLRRQGFSGQFVKSWSDAVGGRQILAEDDHMTDVVWRHRWVQARSAVTECRSRAIGNKRTGATSLRAFKDLPKTSMYALMDDYILRVSTPAHLFNQITANANQVRAADAAPFKKFQEVFPVSREIGVANTLDMAPFFAAIDYPGRTMLAYLSTGKVGGIVEGVQAHEFPKWDRASLLGTNDAVEVHPSDVTPGATTPVFPALDVANSGYVFTLFNTIIGKGEVAHELYLPTRGGKLQGQYAVVLGRYDIATLVSADEENSRLSNRPSAAGKSSLHRRFLSQIDVCDTSPPKLQSTVAVTFVALSSPLAWRLVALWIQTHLAERKLANSHLRLSVFFSDGWEQLVVFYHVRETQPSNPIADVYTAKTSFSGHPLVSRTETYFLGKVFDYKPPAMIDFSIRFRGRTLTGRHISTSDLKRALENSRGLGDVRTWRQKFGVFFELQVDILSGLTDYEVRVLRCPILGHRVCGVEAARQSRRSALLMAAYKALHRALNECGHLSRLQTQFAFGEKQ